MGLISKTVITKWNPRNKAYYEEKGYIFTKMKDEFKVKVEDLILSSSVYVEVKCDNCDINLKLMKYNSYNRRLHDNDKYYCRKCASKLFGKEKYKKVKLKNSISFEQWCYNNLDVDYANEILSRWDYNLNNCNPSEVSYSSAGINKKGYYFKCHN